MVSRPPDVGVYRGLAFKRSSVVVLSVVTCGAFHDLRVLLDAYWCFVAVCWSIPVGGHDVFSLASHWRSAHFKNVRSEHSAKWGENATPLTLLS